MTICLQFDKIMIPMSRWHDLKTFIKLSIIICSSFLCLKSPVLSHSLDESLLIIRGGFEDGLYDLAASEARSFIARGAGHEALGEVYLILGYIDKHNRNYSNAHENFLRATVSDYSDIRVQAYYEAASIDWMQSNYSAASANFLAVTEQDYSSAVTDQSHYWLIMSLYRAGKFSKLITKATDVLEEGYNLSADQLIQILYCRGKAHFHKNQYEDALPDLESVFQTGSIEFIEDAIITLAQIHVNRGELKTADFWAQQRLESSYSRQAHLIRSNYAIKQGNYICASHHLTTIALNPETETNEKLELLVKATLCEAEILIASNKEWWNPFIDYCLQFPQSPYLDLILQEIARLNDIQPMPAEYMTFMAQLADWNPAEHGALLARLFLTNNDHNTALYWLVRYFSENDDKSLEPVDRLLFARLLSAVGDQDTARDELVRLDFSSDEGFTDIDAVFEQADFFMRAGMYQRAAALFQQITVTADIDKHVRERAMFSLANAWFQLEEWGLAGSVYKRLVDSEPDDFIHESATRRLGLSMLYAENWQGLFDATVMYLKHFPETDYIGEMYYLKGLSEANLGKPDAAFQSLGIALDLLTEPELVEQVKEAIRQLSEYSEHTMETSNE